jgi:ribosome maturation factor RimP
VPTPQANTISQLATQAAAAHGLVLVVARLTGQQGRLTLEVLLEQPDGTSPTVEDCTKVSRMLSAQLDVAEVINGRYQLEVGSPGLERPLLSVADCTRFMGRHAQFKFTQPISTPLGPLGAAKGAITKVEGETVTLALSPTHHTSFTFGMVYTAELAPTPAEMAEFMHSANQRKDA